MSFAIANHSPIETTRLAWRQISWYQVISKAKDSEWRSLSTQTNEGHLGGMNEALSSR